MLLCAVCIEATACLTYCLLGLMQVEERENGSHTPQQIKSTVQIVLRRKLVITTVVQVRIKAPRLNPDRIGCLRI